MNIYKSDFFSFII